MICIARQKVSTMPQIHIQLRLRGVGIVSVECRRPSTGSRDSTHFSAPVFGS